MSAIVRLAVDNESAATLAQAKALTHVIDLGTAIRRDDFVEAARLYKTLGDELCAWGDAIF